MSASVRLARTAGLYHPLGAVSAGCVQAIRLSLYIPDDATPTKILWRTQTSCGSALCADLAKATFAVFGAPVRRTLTGRPTARHHLSNRHPDPIV
jgi:hypothetical protein